MFEGIDPPIKLRIIFIAFKLIPKSPIELGISPVSKFFLTSITFAFVRAPNDDGSSPVNMFTFRARFRSSPNFPTELGIDPDNKFELR